MAEAKATPISVEGLYEDRKALTSRLETLKVQIAAMQAEMNTLKDQADELDIAIRVIEKRQGKSPSIPSSPHEVQRTTPAGIPGSLSGLTWAAAAKKVLENAGGRPLKTADILKQIEAGGREFTGTRRYSNLYSALNRNSIFKLSKRGWVVKEKEGEDANED